MLPPEFGKNAALKILNAEIRRVLIDTLLGMRRRSSRKLADDLGQVLHSELSPTAPSLRTA